MFRLEIRDDTIRDIEWWILKNHVIALLRDIFLHEYADLHHVAQILQVQFAYVRRHKEDIWVHLLMSHSIPYGPLLSVILTFIADDTTPGSLIMTPRLAEVSRVGLTKGTYRFNRGVWIPEARAEKKNPLSELF